MRTHRSRLTLCTTLFPAVLLVLSVASLPSAAQSITFSPYKIVLNAQGAAESFQAVIRMPLEAGYTLSSYDVKLLVNGEEVAQAFSFRYCYVDSNFLAEFDRDEVLNSPVVLALANSTAMATVEGSYTAVNSAGDTITHTFSTSSAVEILAPKKG